MKYPRILTLMSLPVLLVAGLWSAALGQATDGNLANVIGGGSSVRFEIVAQHAGATLTITAPDGRSFTKEFKTGSSPGFEFGDKSLPDGSYGYELRLRPVLTAGQREALKEGRGKDDDPEAERAARKRPVLPNMTQSGAFALTNGQVIVAGLSENQRTAKATVAPASKPASTSEVASGNTAARLRNHRASLFSSLMFDQVIPDDLIVQGSACIGLDCVNNESFGFDTIRLKENNTRIKFEDTSVGSFPTNDWQLTANDSASGGASKFSIEDITGARVPFTVTAGAPTNSIFVDSTGRLGLRTSTPVLDIHARTSNTPALRLEQSNSGGFMAQTWDVAGNEANFFVRDVTSGSRLPFRIRPGAPTSSIDISGDGNVGIGTASASRQLTVFGVGSSVAQVTTEAGANTGMTLQSDASNRYVWSYGALPMLLGTNNSERMRITSDGNVGIGTTGPTALLSVNGTANKPGGGSWDVFSDERLKNIKGRFTPGLSAVMRLQPLRYEYKANNPLSLTSGKDYVGFGAQELQKVLPEAVSTNANGYLQVNNDPIIWTMLNAIKEQQKEIEALKGQIKKLQTHRRRK
jgi:Chaperone of endosialidase